MAFLRFVLGIRESGSGLFGMSEDEIRAERTQDKVVSLDKVSINFSPTLSFHS